MFNRPIQPGSARVVLNAQYNSNWMVNQNFGFSLLTDLIQLITEKIQLEHSLKGEVLSGLKVRLHENFKDIVVEADEGLPDLFKAGIDRAVRDLSGPLNRVRKGTQVIDNVNRS